MFKLGNYIERNAMEQDINQQYRTGSLEDMQMQAGGKKTTKIAN